MTTHRPRRLLNAEAVGLAAITVAAVMLSAMGCHLAVEFELAGVRLGMGHDEVLEVLGEPRDSFSRYDFAWLMYDNGVTVGLSGYPPDSQGMVAWVSQTKGSCLPGMAIGDSDEVLRRRFESAQRALGPDGRPLLRFVSVDGPLLDVALRDGRACGFVLHHTVADPRSPYPDPDLFPRFELAGVRLLMGAAEVEGLFGRAEAIEEMDTWTSWRYPSRGLVVDLAPVRDGEPEPRVVWVMQDEGAYAPGFGVGDPVALGEPMFGSLSGDVDVRNERGEMMTLMVAGGKLRAVILRLENPPVPPASATGPIPAIFPSELAGINLNMQDSEVRAVLGEPDIIAGNEPFRWEYLELGLTLRLASADPGTKPLTVSRVEQRRGTWRTLAVGCSQSEAETRLARTVVDVEGRQVIRLENERRWTFDVLFLDGTTVGFILAIEEGY